MRRLAPGKAGLLAGVHLRGWLEQTFDCRVQGSQGVERDKLAVTGRLREILKWKGGFILYPFPIMTVTET